MGSLSTTSEVDSSESGPATSSSTGGPDSCEVEPPCEGCESWRDEFDGPAGENDGFVSLSVAPNGDLLAFGHQDVGLIGGGPGAARIVRYSPGGELQWTQVLEPDQGSFSATSGLVEDAGTIVIALRVLGVQNNEAPWTSIVRLTEQGEPLGEPERFAEDSSPLALIRAGDSVLLHSYNHQSARDRIRLERLEDNTLEPLFPPEAFEDLQPGEHTMSPGRGDTILVAGTTADQTPYLARLAQEDSGAWTTAWTLEQFDAVDETRDGEGDIVAATALPDGSTVFVLSAGGSLTTGLLDPSQQPIWTRTLDLGDSAQPRPEIAADQAGRIYVVGRAPGSPAPPRLLALSGCDGTELWSWDVGNGVGVGTVLTAVDNRLFLAGTSFEDSGVSYTQAWVAALDL